MFPMEPAADRVSQLQMFVARHTSLLETIAGAWLQAGAGRFVWRGADGQVIYALGEPTSGGISLPLLDGALSVEGGAASQQPLLAAQVVLLQEAIEREAGADLLVDELMRTTDQLVALYEVSAAARTGRNLDDVTRTCLEQAVRLTGAERALLIQRERMQDGYSLRTFAFPERNPAGVDFPEALLSRLVDNRDAVVANTPEECAALCGCPPEVVTRAACAPFLVNGKVEAVLCVLDKPIDFISGDLKLIIALADAVAGFLERERSHQRELAQARVQRELEIAAEIQSRLLPGEVPTLPGVQVAALSQPAHEVGGDFFDVQVLAGGALALALGDITSKGVPAALFMAMARVLLRAGLHSLQSPGEATRQLNAQLGNDLSNADMLLTLFAATFEPVTGKLRVMNCGHGPVLVCRQGGVTLWEADGPPIGLLPELLSVEHEQRLERGDVLVVLSDGFSEARDVAGNRIGVAPLIAVVRDAAAGAAVTIAEALRRRVETFGQGSPPDDDQTLIVMKVE
jgi:sigma-B regulation protein RsbU (phosphoserine phosphatase)